MLTCLLWKAFTKQLILTLRNKSIALMAYKWEASPWQPREEPILQNCQSSHSCCCCCCSRETCCLNLLRFWTYFWRSDHSSEGHSQGSFLLRRRELIATPGRRLRKNPIFLAPLAVRVIIWKTIRVFNSIPWEMAKIWQDFNKYLEKFKLLVILHFFATEPIYQLWPSKGIAL